MLFLLKSFQITPFLTIARHISTVLQGGVGPDGEILGVHHGYGHLEGCVDGELVAIVLKQPVEV